MQIRLRHLNHNFVACFRFMSNISKYSFGKLKEETWRIKYHFQCGEDGNRFFFINGNILLLNSLHESIFWKSG